MPRLTPSTELDHLVALITEHSSGIGSDALLRVLGDGWQRRRLQRRLALLARQGRIRTLGEGRSTRYLHALQRSTEVDEDVATASDQVFAELHVPTSPEGADIREHVRQARQLRRPVGYRQEFLEQYHPNQTAYLPADLRAQLQAMGRPLANHAPAGTFARDILQRLLIDLSWALSQLEGNTYTRLDAERLIAHGSADR